MSEEVNKLQNNIIGLTRFLNSYILQVLQELFDLSGLNPFTMHHGSRWSCARKPDSSSAVSQNIPEVVARFL